MRKWKEELLDQRRRMMEEKLLHAEFKREIQLQAIVKKAQEEEAKVCRFVMLYPQQHPSNHPSVGMVTTMHFLLICSASHVWKVVLENSENVLATCTGE